MAQTWLARSDLSDRADPYHLYAASNAGSLIGLLGYPFLLEPLFGLGAQTRIWTIAYLVHAGLALAIGASLRTSFRVAPEEAAACAAPALRTKVGWFLLSVAPAILLMAVTNAIAIQVGSLPMFWVLPLAVYLLTFILAFGRGPGRPGHGRVLWLSLLPLIPVLWLPAWRGLALHLFVLFHLALACHAELYRRRPDARELGTFYFAVALGGLAGGVFVGLVAPLCFTALYELGIGLALSLGSLVAARREELRAWLSKRAAVAWFRRCESRALRLAAAIPLAVASALSLAACWSATVAISRVDGRFAHRNFYGIYAIREGAADEIGLPGSTGGGRAPVRALIHGRTLHGFEVLAPDGGRPPRAAALRRRRGTPRPGGWRRRARGGLLRRGERGRPWTTSIAARTIASSRVGGPKQALVSLRSAGRGSSRPACRSAATHRLQFLSSPPSSHRTGSRGHHEGNG